MRILAVDDDPIALGLLGSSLEKSGFGSVTYASTADEALNLISQSDKPFDTFLLDIMMPGISGTEMCRLIRQKDAYQLAPIIMITASRDHAIMAQAFDAGATDYVTKPFDGLELGTRINLAATLSDSLRREKANTESAQELARLTAISFDERSDLPDGPGVNGFLALENELLRKGDALYAMTLFSMQIEDALALFRSVTPGGYRMTLSAIARTLSSISDNDTTRFAHAGRGAFVVVVQDRARQDLQALEDQLNLTLAENWDSEATGLSDAPMVVLDALDDKRLWSGHSAALAMRNFHGRADLRRAREPEETETLFSRLSQKIAS
ncbi:PleD family two-component system response regulator [Sulfitobacter sp. S190]|uniref:response regulator n=1 Tax=Sulfitobacter sp. S190 TaxID=2867022 RepID=UPI0021A7C4B8|nr:response regulator [Sulfitobacter sp. S190]UWR22047.1 response regulator [Sulfitobacter sp. S190]